MIGFLEKITEKTIHKLLDKYRPRIVFGWLAFAVIVAAALWISIEILKP